MKVSDFIRKWSDKLDPQGLIECLSAEDHNQRGLAVSNVKSDFGLSAVDVAMLRFDLSTLGSSYVRVSGVATDRNTEAWVEYATRPDGLIDAVRSYRQEHGVSLKTAVDYVRHWRQQRGISNH